ncbi:hypothetical protein MO973_10220 [Paenibacillus sp. TRM 82003]|nr:hypothetical protein [Paenibacillus sp. TRM 82003]
MLERIPLPYVQIDRDHKLLFLSSAASEQFPAASSFLQWADVGSTAKVKEWLQPDAGAAAAKVELNLRTAEGELLLFDVYQRWDETGVGHMSLVRAQHAIEPLLSRIAEMREQVRRQPSIPPDPTPSGAAVRGLQEAMDRLKDHLGTVRDLLSLLRNDLLEAGKEAYEALIVHQLEEAERLADEAKKTPGSSA